MVTSRAQRRVYIGGSDGGFSVSKRNMFNSYLPFLPLVRTQIAPPFALLGKCHGHFFGVSLMHV